MTKLKGQEILLTQADLKDAQYLEVEHKDIKVGELYSLHANFRVDDVEISRTVIGEVLDITDEGDHLEVSLQGKDETTSKYVYISLYKDPENYYAQVDVKRIILKESRNQDDRNSRKEDVKQV